MKSANMQVMKASYIDRTAVNRPRTVRKEHKSSNVSDHPHMYSYKKPHQENIGIACRVPVMYEISTPNKPFHTPRRESGLYSKPTLSFMNSYKNSVSKPPLDSANLSSKATSAMSGTPKFKDFKETKSEVKEVKVETIPKVNGSWNILTKISNWISKELTIFP